MAGQAVPDYASQKTPHSLTVHNYNGPGGAEFVPSEYYELAAVESARYICHPVQFKSGPKILVYVHSGLSESEFPLHLLTHYNPEKDDA